MGMGRILPGMVAAPFMLHDAGGVPQGSVLIDGQNRHAAAAVVRREEEPAPMIHPNVRQALAAGRPASCKGEPARPAIDAEGCYVCLGRAFAPVFVDSVQDVFPWMKRQERRVLD